VFPKDTKILILDDMLGIRQMLKNILKDLGYLDVTAVENGQLGWDLLCENFEGGQPFNLILSDWNMPVLTGIDLLKKVRGHTDFEKLPFLLITAEGEFSNVKAALALKVNSYIMKPFTPAGIKTKLELVWKQIQAPAKRPAA